MTDHWLRYRSAAPPLPGHSYSWPFHGAGLESLGVDGRPVLEPLPEPGPDELLVRVDALGICASDGKMVRMGPRYPLFSPRDWANDPIRLGHEAAMTVIKVGEQWRGQFHPGQRLGVQANVFIGGERAIFGVNISGAMAQYVLLDRRVLAADECYVFPTPDSLSYSDIALLEPWACVEVAYTPVRRLEPKAGGTLWLVGNPEVQRTYSWGQPLAARRVVLSDAPQDLAAWVRAQGVEVCEGTGLGAQTLVERFTGGAGFDDIVLLQPGAATVVAEAARSLADAGLLNLVTDAPLDGDVAVDIGRLHYEPLGFVGCTGPDISAAYGLTRNRSELRPGGVVWIAGAGGTMGRMHLQRALELAEGPRAVIVTNRGEARLRSLVRDFGPLAQERGIEQVAISPQLEPGRLEREVERLTDGQGCDDIVIVVPDPVLMARATSLLAPNGMMVFYAGVPKGTEVPLPLDRAALAAVQFTGTSGSTLADQMRVLDRVAAGLLDPSRPVAAVGGIKAMAAAVAAVIEGRYPGKVVVYPQFLDLPLLSLMELAERLPAVGSRLAPGPVWTAEAERALFEVCLAGGC